MRNLFRMAIALAAGAAAMYYLDPRHGRRRRALVRDQGISAGHRLTHLARANARNASDRLRGVVARARSRLAHSGPVDDALLRERILSRLGHVASRPGAIEVTVREGRVVLSGVAASRGEIDEVVHAVATTRGVGEVDNLLAPDYSEHADVLGAAQP